MIGELGEGRRLYIGISAWKWGRAECRSVIQTFQHLKARAVVERRKIETRRERKRGRREGNGEIVR